MVKLIYLFILFILLSIINIDHSILLDGSSYGDVTSNSVYKWFIETPVKKIELYSYMDKVFTLIETDLKTIVVGNNSRVELETIGKKYYYLIGDKLVITSISSGIDLYIYSLSKEKVIATYTMDSQIMFFKKILGIIVDGYIEIYYEARDLNGLNKLVTLKYDEGNIYVESISLINNSFWRSNIVWGVTLQSNVSETMIYGKQIVLIEEKNNTYVSIDNDTEIFAGKIFFEKPVLRINNILYILLRNGNDLSIIKYNRTYTYREIPYYMREYVLEDVVPTTTSLIIIYRNSEVDDQYRLVYIDPTELDIVKTMDVKTLIHPLILYIDLERDGLSDLLVYREHYIGIMYTVNYTVKNIYWDHFNIFYGLSSKPIICGRNIYFGVIYRSGEQYVVELIKHIIGEEFDKSPPLIKIYSPQSNGIYSDSVYLNISAVDLESNIYLLEVIISSENSIIYHKQVYSSNYSYRLVLGEGVYCLKVVAWNSDGLKNVSTTVFYVVEDDIVIMYPRNYSVVNNYVNISLVSNNNYTLEYVVNGSAIDTVKIGSGSYYYLLNLTSYPDGLIILEIRVIETNHLILIYLYKDTVPPLIKVHGLVNNTVVKGVIVFELEISDPHFDHAIVFLNNTVLAEYSENGIYNVTLVSWRYVVGRYVLKIYSIDKAGNENSSTYIIYINETGKPEIYIEPSPPNNTFVHGFLEYNVSGNNIYLLEIYVDNKIYRNITCNGSLEIVIGFNTSNWVDGEYDIVFIGYGSNNTEVTIKYIWYIDNSPPLLYMDIPARGWGGVWRNNSFIPLFDPDIHSLRYIIDVNGSKYFRLYVNISDYWLDKAYLYLNNSLTTIIYNDHVYPGIFNESRGYLIYVKIIGEGYYVLRLTGKDRVGRVSQYFLGLWIDLSKPVLVFNSPRNNTVLETSELNIVYTVNDTYSRFIALGINIQENNYSRPGLDEYVPLAPYPIVHVNDTYNSTIELRTRDGVYYVSLIAIDQSMNYDVETLVVVIDTTPPEIYGNVSVAGYTLVINLSFTDNLAGFANASIYLNNTLLDNISTPYYYNEYLLEPGKHIVKIIAYDKAGNKAIETYNVTIEETELINNTLPPSTGKPSRIESITRTGLGGEGGGINIYVYILIIVLAAILILYVLKKKR